LLCAIAESEIVGTGAIKRLDNRECEMVRMFVALAYRGRGIGWTIADELIRFARIAGYDRIRLSSNNSLMASHRLYERLGFRPAFFPGTQAAGHTHVTIPFRYQIPRNERLSCNATFEKSSTDLPDGQITLRPEFPVQPSCEKYSASPNTQIKLITITVSSLNEGRIAIVTDVGMGCGGRDGVVRAILNRRAMLS
jgi:predicted N-acetyltransferase YhbS